MRIWIAKNDKKAIDWYSFKGDFIPLKVFFSDEGGELMTISLTDADQFRLTKIARIPELKMHYLEIVEKSAAKWGTLYKAFRAQIYGSYFVVTHEDFTKGAKKWVAERLDHVIDEKDRSELFDSLEDPYQLLKNFKGDHYKFDDCIIFDRYSCMTQNAANFVEFLDRDRKRNQEK